MAPLPIMEDLALRQRIFDRLSELVDDSGGALSRSVLESLEVGPGEVRRLIDTSRGIWNPQDLNATLAIVSSPDGPYADREVQGGWFRYDYRAGSVDGDNRKLREAMRLQLPLILLRKIATGVFVPIFPVYVVEDDQTARQFVVAVDETLRFLAKPSQLTEIERRFAERITKQRLHQAMFRGMVVRAYEVRCAVCRLAHGELLDAAHITPDAEETGLAVVTNGLALCKIHHAAYDRNLMGISPSFEVRINDQLLVEIDGPMLRHGLQEMHGRTITLPRRESERPDRDRLAARYAVFRAG